MFAWLKQLFASPLSENIAIAPDGTLKAEATTADSSRNSACNRLRLVLMHDRTQLEPPVMEAMREELVTVISKYVDIERDAIELNLETDPETNTVALVANIPVHSSRRKDVTEVNAAEGESANNEQVSSDLKSEEKAAMAT